MRSYKVQDKPRYYVRMHKDGLWYFLLRVSYDKQEHCMKPVWWPERMIGVSKPYLYRTLTGARGAQDTYVSPLAIKSEVKQWQPSSS